MLTDLMGPEFRPGTGMACPCPMIPRVQLKHSRATVGTTRWPIMLDIVGKTCVWSRQKEQLKR